MHVLSHKDGVQPKNIYCIYYHIVQYLVYKHDYHNHTAYYCHTKMVSNLSDIDCTYLSYSIISGPGITMPP